MSYANAMQHRHMALVIEDNSFLNSDLLAFLKRMNVDHKLVLDSWQG
jgi:DNA-binding response OmpR family regulator